jgi:ribosomal protein S17
MDNQATEPSNEPLNIDGAAQAFGALLEPAEAIEKSPQELEQEALAELSKKPGEAPAVEAAEPDAGEGAVTIKVDGKDVTLTAEQLADAYKNGLRQKDYTQKTMEVAEQRKQAEAQLQQAQQERQAYASNLQKMAAQIEGALQQQQQIDWEQLLENNPEEYLRQKHLYEKRQAAYQANLQEQDKIAYINQQEQAKHFQSHLQNQQEEILAKIPEWKDPQKAKVEATAIQNYLLESGFDPDVVKSVADAKTIQIARKAMLYDAVMAKAAAATKRVQAAPQKVVRPGVVANDQDSDQRAAQMRKLAKSGKIEDAASLFAQYI